MPAWYRQTTWKKEDVASKQHQLATSDRMEKEGEVSQEASSDHMEKGGEVQQSEDDELANLVAKFPKDGRQDGGAKRARSEEKVAAIGKEA